MADYGIWPVYRRPRHVSAGPASQKKYNTVFMIDPLRPPPCNRRILLHQNRSRENHSHVLLRIHNRDIHSHARSQFALSEVSRPHSKEYQARLLIAPWRDAGPLIWPSGIDLAQVGRIMTAVGYRGLIVVILLADCCCCPSRYAWV